MSRIRLVLFKGPGRAEPFWQRLNQSRVVSENQNLPGLAHRRLRAHKPSWAVGLILLLLNQIHLLGAEVQPPATTPLSAHSEHPTYLRDVLPILMGKCARCHNAQSPVMSSWLDYKTASAQRWEIKRRVWDSWNGSYFKQPMPTVNSPEFEAISDEERAIIRDWVESGAVCGVRPAFNSQSRAERIESGKRLFATICAACHQPTGQGIPGRFPPLAGSDFLNADKHRAIKIVVNGLQGEVMVNGQKFNNSMPQFPLSDEDIASALTFVYSSFGNSGKDVTAGEVSSVRAEKVEPNELGQNRGPATQEPSPYE
jgi:mono/diheme cytochrome c family protein